MVIGPPSFDFGESVIARMNPREPRRVRYRQFIRYHMYHINFVVRMPLKVTPVLLGRNPRRDNTSLGRANSRSETGYLANTVARERG